MDHGAARETQRPEAPRPGRRRRRVLLALALSPLLLWVTRAWTVHPAVVALAPWIGRQLGCELELAHLESDWWSELRVEVRHCFLGLQLAFRPPGCQHLPPLLQTHRRVLPGLR